MLIDCVPNKYKELCCVVIHIVHSKYFLDQVSSKLMFNFMGRFLHVNLLDLIITMLRNTVWLF